MLKNAKMVRLSSTRTRLLAETVVALILFGTGSAQHVYTSQSYRVVSYEPEFLEPLKNVTVTEGREATFTCVVDHLGGYRGQWVGVAWIKADTKAILAIHNRVITHNNRMNVIHSDHKTWELKIRDVKRNDSGEYMCQINTDPMKMQVGYLNVVIPPDIEEKDTSGDVMVPEGSTVKLACKAKGFPEPRIEWRRENGKSIVLRPPNQPKNEVLLWEGPELMMDKVARDDMGAYLCIASNDIPPAVSKRIVVQVHFHPLIRIRDQLVGAPIGTNVTLECEVEASPKSINYWSKIQNSTGPQIVNSRKYINEEIVVNDYTLIMKLTIKKLELEDFTAYKCTAKNSLGEVQGTITLYEIQLLKPMTTAQDPIVDTIGHEIDHITDNNIDIPRSHDRHRGGDHAPRQSIQSVTIPTPPSRPRNTHQVPYLPSENEILPDSSTSVCPSTLLLLITTLSALALKLWTST
ncbi:neurotrimin-like isoform X1 [Macrobrachium nipponense]|uniref:neurotrimin-like isoform X1 n=2 Tax=Macrobrachium nipponense TaxID=159736 RepID=UPI0030C7C281